MGCLSWGLARPTADPVRTFPLAQLAASNRPPRIAVSVGWTGWTGKGNSERGRGSVLTITQRPRTLWVRRRHSEISRILLATVYRFALLLQNASIYPTRRLAHQNTATNAADWLPSPSQSSLLSISLPAAKTNSLYANVSSRSTQMSSSSAKFWKWRGRCWSL
jgi:hypothetical protein